jgi:hypothetical protein
MAPSSMIQSDAEAIRELATDVVGDEADAWKAAQRLERWVFENVSKKNMNVAFASALEVCENREGDCTEHAVLLAALCRAAGIPSRVVMGLEYLYGIWGGHAWNEVYVDGAWYPLDATNGLGFVDPLHLPMAHLTLKDGGSAEFIAVLQGIGKLDVDITEVVRGGRTILVGDPSLVTTETTTYTNRALGIAFASPEGFVFDPPKREGRPSSRVMELDGETEALRSVEIQVDLTDAPAEDWWSWLASLGSGEPQTVSELSVDGRPARRVTRTRSDGPRTRVIVIYDGALWIFTLDRGGSEAAQEAFADFLASVDFDVR